MTPYQQEKFHGHCETLPRNAGDAILTSSLWQDYSLLLGGVPNLSRAELVL